MSITTAQRHKIQMMVEDIQTLSVKSADMDRQLRNAVATFNDYLYALEKPASTKDGE